MIKEIIKDEEILSKKCEKATPEDSNDIDDLMDTIKSMDDVACLAANQIGITKSFGIYLDEDDEPHLVLNPILKKALYPMRTEEECFSRDVPSKVTRYGWVCVEYDTLVDGELIHKKEEFTGRDAQVIHHLIDHCKGKLV